MKSYELRPIGFILFFKVNVISYNEKDKKATLDRGRGYWRNHDRRRERGDHFKNTHKK